LKRKDIREKREERREKRYGRYCFSLCDLCACCEKKIFPHRGTEAQRKEKKKDEK